LRWVSHNSLDMKLLRASEKSEYPEGSDMSDTRQTHVSHYGTQANNAEGCLWERDFRQTQLGTAPAIMPQNFIFSTYPRLVSTSVNRFNIQQDRHCKYNVVLKRVRVAIFCRG
jgi:hypothetical protein